MVRNKKRLYVAVYPSGMGQDSYHWALVVGPKAENGPARGQRYHVRNHKVGGWTFASNRLVDVRVTVQLLARITIAKIEDEERVIEAIQKVPVDPIWWDGQECGREPRWTCRVWLLAALKTIKDDKTMLGTNVLNDVDGIIETTKAFVAKQRENRRYDSHAMEPKPVLDMITGEERYTKFPYKSSLSYKDAQERYARQNSSTNVICRTGATLPSF